MDTFETDYSRVFEENTYIQYVGEMFIHIRDKDTKIRNKNTKYFEQYLGDEKPIILQQ
jgi:hypothetical protein